MSYHRPVLIERVRAFAAGKHRVVDATAGGGGHLAALLADGASVLAIDRDPEAIAAARQRVADAPVTWLNDDFGSPAAHEAVSRFAPDFVLLDLGVSSHQIDADRRGFSFRRGVPLDMRMDPRGGPTAADLLNGLPPDRIAEILRDYGDEPRARALAKQIVRRREQTPFATAEDLVNAIRAVHGPRSGPAVFARVFQAVRIAVNDELEALARTLPVFRDALVPGGALAVITYHSGEDRLVKRAFREWAAACVCPSAQPVCTCRGRPLGRLLNRKPILPDAEEIELNPRARSAKLRVFQVRDDG